MRTIYELLKIVENRIKQEGLITKGICGQTLIMVIDGEISIKERVFLYNYIMKNPPQSPFNHYYHWRPGLLQPRLDWLKEHIELTKDDKYEEL